MVADDGARELHAPNGGHASLTCMLLRCQEHPKKLIVPTGLEEASIGQVQPGSVATVASAKGRKTFTLSDTLHHPEGCKLAVHSMSRLQALCEDGTAGPWFGLVCLPLR
jgi:hypothetical protein